MAPFDEIAERHGAALLLQYGSTVVARCRLLAGSPRRLAELEIYAWKRYVDHRPYLAMEGAYLDRVLAARGFARGRRPLR